MDFLTLTLELFRNADHFIMYIAQTYGWWVYLVLFMIFYSETGIVICAFLPGDSLLFIAGARCFESLAPHRHYFSGRDPRKYNEFLHRQLAWQ